MGAFVVVSFRLRQSIFSSWAHRLAEARTRAKRTSFIQSVCGKFQAYEDKGKSRINTKKICVLSQFVQICPVVKEFFVRRLFLRNVLFRWKLVWTLCPNIPGGSLASCFSSAHFGLLSHPSALWCTKLFPLDANTMMTRVDLFQKMEFLFLSVRPGAQLHTECVD